MRRSASEASCGLVARGGIQVPPPHDGEKAAVALVVGPPRVAVPLVKLGLEIVKMSSELVLKSTKYSGEPGGGGVLPSRSAGRTPPKFVLSWKQICVAAAPASMEVRSKAHSLGPAKVCPLLKML